MNRQCILAFALLFALSAPAFSQPKELTPEERADVDARMKTSAGVSVCAVLGFVAAGVFSIIIWTAPIWIAMMRGHPDTAAIALVTFFLGCTGIGWLVALIWSVKSFARDRHGRARDW
jgi:hypothetical protein